MENLHLRKSRTPTDGQYGNQEVGCSQSHLQQEEQVNLGSYYTPGSIVKLVWQMISAYINKDINMPPSSKSDSAMDINTDIDAAISTDAGTVILDNSCGYGSFLSNDFIPTAKLKLVGADIDQTALEVAQQSHPQQGIKWFHANALTQVARSKYGIAEQDNLIVIGNPPYNDKTSLIRNKIKDISFEIDAELVSRDVGVSFLLAYDKLKADMVCVLHPLSYLIKPANFAALKEFAKNYRLLDGLLISSQVFSEASKTTSFPILVALYQRDAQGMDYEYIKQFNFRTQNGAGAGADFRLKDFDYISNYVDKYPKKNHNPAGQERLFFWTLRDINALKRNQTFITKYSSNAIVIDKAKLDYYIYIDVFKRNLDKLPFYFGNCDVVIDDKSFQEYRDSFVSDAVRHHPALEEYVTPLNGAAKQGADIQADIDAYFHKLLGVHYEIRSR